MERRIRRRHLAAAWVLVGLLVAELLLVLVGGHRGQHMARDLIVPGAGLLDEHTAIGVAVLAVAVAATVLWLRWGADWMVAAVMVAALLCTAALTSPHDAAAASAWVARRGAHEFPLVVLVAGMLSWLRSVLVRVPGVSRLRRRRRHAADVLESLSPVDRCRAVTLLALAHPEDARRTESLRHAVAADDVARRARRVGAVARLRFGGDPFRRDHAHARTARLACGADDDGAAAALATDAARSPMGVPCSEPGWVRPLDATLAALVLRRRGEVSVADAVGRALRGPWQRRGDRRPAWTWTPAMVAAGSATPWEHATTTALAHAAGLVGDAGDLAALRRRMLGAAARRSGHPEDERLVAAARLWLTQADDLELRRVVERCAPGTDPLAAAITTLSRALAAHPDLLRPTV